MTTFANAEEAEKYIGGIFEQGIADPAIGSKLSASGLVLRTAMTNPDSVVTADLVNGTVHYGLDEGPQPNMTLTLDGATANRFWQGKVSIPLAIARGQIQVSGAVPKLVALLPHAKTLYAAYAARLAADGRNDLLV